MSSWLKRRFSAAEPKITTAQRSPATLKAFEAALSVIVRASTSGDSDAKGT